MDLFNNVKQPTVLTVTPKSAKKSVKDQTPMVRDGVQKKSKTPVKTPKRTSKKTLISRIITSEVCRI